MSFEDTAPQRTPFRLTGATTSEQRQKLRQDALGHAPDNMLLMPKNARIDLNSAGRHDVLMPGFRSRQGGERQPERKRDFAAEN